MKATNRLALWLVLAADAMFCIGLLGASRLMPHSLDRGAMLRDIIAIGVLIVGRLLLRWRKLLILAGVIALSALLLLIPVLRLPVDSEWLLHATLVGHVATLVIATFATVDEIRLLWEFVIALGCVVIASAM